MKIRIVIEETAPLVAEGTYVYSSGEIAGMSTRDLLRGIDSFVLKSLDDLYALRVADKT